MRKLLAGVLVAVLLSGCAAGTGQQRGGRSSADAVALSTPPGIRIARPDPYKPVVFRGVYFGSPKPLPLVFADSQRQPLYTFDSDPAGQSTCTGECVETWRPLVAPPRAKVVGDWSVIKRDDGAMQWAIGGKPVYTYAANKSVAVYKADVTEGLTPEQRKLWRIALVAPQSLVLPVGIDVAELAQAPGQGLVNRLGRTLYAFEGDINDDRRLCDGAACEYEFVPELAGALAVNKIGEFEAVSRKDGGQQWTYRGKPLYTYEGDAQEGDISGQGLDQRFHVALIMRHFLPDGVAISRDQRRGGLLTTAEGMTLYSRDTTRWTSDGNHSKRGSQDQNGVDRIGEAVGTSTCGDACENLWRPLKAPANAQPSGYWSVYTRQDGSKQWAYKSYALYTYALDQKPGDTFGIERYEFFVGSNARDVVTDDNGQKLSDELLGLGFFWRAPAP